MKRFGVVRARGMLRHQFFGSYGAVIALCFTDTASARDAAATLRAPWSLSESGIALVASLDRESLELEKERLARYGADPKKIDSLAKSVDYGEPFTVEIPVIPAEQCELFSGWAP